MRRGSAAELRARRGRSSADWNHMDLATLIGYLLAWGALGFGIFHASHGAFGAYISPFEMITVGGCAFGAAMASMPLHAVINAMGSVKKLILGGDAHIEHLIK